MDDPFVPVVNADDASVPEADARVPVTILTGFLGAGKTTLLRHVLTEKHGLRIAVIQNELSATTGLEAATMRGPNGEWFENWMELSNGCVCCEVRDELPFALERLMEAKGRFDYVLIETTGMADPGPVAASLWLDDELESPLALDGVVTLVDALHASRHLDTVEWCRQIASADVLLLNKCDAVSDEVELANLEARLRTINALATIRRTAHSHVPLGSILNIHAFARDLHSLRPLAPRAPAAAADAVTPLADAAAASLCDCCRQPVCAACEEPPAEAASAVVAPVDEPGGATRSMHRDGRFGSVTLLLGAAPLRLGSLQAWLARLFWEGEDESGDALDGAAPAEGGETGLTEVYRAKGVVAIAPEDGEDAARPARYTLQAVHETWELTEGPAWGAEEPQSRFVFIGRNLDEVAFRRGLEACRANEIVLDPALA